MEGSKTTNYYYQDGVVSYTTDGDNSQISQNLIGTDGNILATQRYGSDHTDYLLYHKDIQGSTTSLVKEDGSADATYRYTDFGETTINGDNKAENEVCYTGGIYDQSTGLYYLNARYYNPEDGGFLTEDTYRGETNEPETQNLYVYCADNPVNYVDPSGHKRINTRRWEMIDATYWYDTKNARCYGRRGEVHYAKSGYNKSLKKYKSLIRKENKKALFAQKMFGQTALYTIADYGIGKFLGLIAKKKVSKIIPKYILDKIKGKVKSGVLKKIGRIVGGGILANARKGVTALKDCKVYHNAIKKEYSKIK